MVRTPTAQGPLSRNCSGPDGIKTVVVGVFVVVDDSEQEFKSNKESNVPLVIRAVVGKGWGQGPQHSKSLHSWFAHLPGINVAVPATAFDAKGLLLESIFGQSPTIIIENRSLFSLKDEVPTAAYRVRYGKAAIRKKVRTLLWSL